MIISIANNKGGMAKTTTAVTMASILHTKGFKVLLIDTDPQCTATDLHVRRGDTTLTLLDVLKNEVSIEDALVSTSHYDLLPGDPTLRDADNMFTGVNRSHLLRAPIEKIKDKYHFILIDTPPAQSVLLYNALTVSNKVIIPVTLDSSSLSGLVRVHEVVMTITQYLNPDLVISGVLVVLHEERTRLSRQLIEEALPPILTHLNITRYDTTIRKAVVVREAMSYNQPLITYAPDDAVTNDYTDFTDEFLKKEGY